MGTAGHAGSPEWLLLTACASPAPELHRVGELARDQDWDAVFDLAEQHGVTSLLAARLNQAGLNAALAGPLTRLKERQRAHIFPVMALTAELLRLLEQFAMAKIDAIPVKGPVLAVRAYGDPGMRHYGDLDLLVRHADIARATELLTRCDYDACVPVETIAAGRVPGEYVFLRRQSRLRVELHTERTLRYFPRLLAIDELFARRKPVLLDGRSVAVLSPEDDLLMLCVHGAKDLWAKLIWTADIAALIHREPALDWQFVFAEARRLGALRMLNTGLQLSSQLLAATLPAGAAEALRDSAAAKLAVQIAHGLPRGDVAPVSILQRALLRVRMRGSFPAGIAYLLRLTLSPTEEDWRASGGPGGILDSPRRFFRLAAKYGRKNQQ